MDKMIRFILAHTSSHLKKNPPAFCVSWSHSLMRVIFKDRPFLLRNDVDMLSFAAVLLVRLCVLHLDKGIKALKRTYYTDYKTKSLMVPKNICYISKPVFVYLACSLLLPECL